MAVDAGCSYFPEAPLIILLVTLETGSGQMCASQLKRAFIVSFNGVAGSFKSLNRMAFHTIWRPSLYCKLLFVIICMTIGTFVMLQFPCISSFVASGAGHHPVFPFKGIAGAGMIEVAHSLHLAKGCLRMALCATLPKFIVMHILVTAGTI